MFVRLAGLPLLKALTIERNRITDHSPLDGLSLDHFTHDLETPCDMAPLPLAPRIENRNFPSLFAAWIDNAKYPAYDLIFCCPRFAARLRQIGDGFQFRTDHASWDGPAGIRDAYLEQNPTMVMVFLHGLAVIWGDTADHSRRFAVVAARRQRRYIIPTGHYAEGLDGS